MSSCSREGVVTGNARTHINMKKQFPSRFTQKNAHEHMGIRIFSGCAIPAKFGDLTYYNMNIVILYFYDVFYQSQQMLDGVY